MGRDDRQDGPRVVVAGAGAFDRLDAAPLVAQVPDGLDLTAPAVLALVRRADLLAPASAAGADALAGVVPLGPWDMLVDPDPTPAAIDAALDRLRRRPRRTRRVALVTPLPPEPTAVACYSARLAVALAQRVEVTCVVAGAGHDELRPAGVTLVDVAEFERASAAGGRFDEIVYVLGNQPRHGTQLALLRRRPGAIELHDVRLVGAYAGLHPPGDALADELARQYPGRYDRTVLREPDLRMGPAVDAGVWMVREAARRATVVLTHSAHATALVAADADVEAVNVGPLACPAVTATRPEPAAGDEALVVSVGVVDPSKRADVLVAALASLPAGTWLALVGPIAEPYRRELQRRAADLGVGARLVMTGRLDDDAYAAMLRRATVAVQLRAHSNGESSAAVADCLAHGVPTVGDPGSLAGLPDDVAARVPADVDAAGLARVVAALVTDVDRRRRLHHAALGFAATNGFEAAATRLLAALFGPGGA